MKRLLPWLRLALVLGDFTLSAWIAGVLFMSFALRVPTNATPITIFHYMFQYGHLPKIGKLIYVCWVFAGSVFVVLLALIFKVRAASPYGDARWATEWGLRRAGLRAKKGLLLGRCWNRFLVADGFEHVLCFAPTRSGKGVGIVIPNLLNWPGSALVHDIKGENFESTSGFRARYGKVYFWNPWDPEGRTHCYNPLDFISKNPGQRIDDIQKIAHLILPEQDFWSNEARTLFVGLVLYLLENSSGPATFGLVLRTLRGQGNFVDYVTRLTETEREQMNAVAYMAMNAFIQKADKEQSAVLSTLNAALELWANPLIDAATSRSDFDLRRLKKELMTVYVGVSPNNLHRLRPLMQVFYQQAVDMMSERKPNLQEEPHPVLFLMDEFPSLGRMTQFEQGIAYLAGYRVRLLLIIQDIPQLETHYQRSGMNTFLGNSKIRVTFAANNFETADLISRLLGTYAAQTDSESESRQKGMTLDPGYGSISKAKMARPLLLPQEILQLPPDEEIVMVEASQPIRARKIRYFEEEVFQRRVQPPISIPTIEAPQPTLISFPQAEVSEEEVEEFLKEDAPENRPQAAMTA